MTRLEKIEPILLEYWPGAIDDKVRGLALDAIDAVLGPELKRLEVENAKECLRELCRDRTIRDGLLSSEVDVIAQAFVARFGTERAAVDRLVEAAKAKVALTPPGLGLGSGAVLTENQLADYNLWEALAHWKVSDG